jgi:hypothetical protein
MSVRYPILALLALALLPAAEKLETRVEKGRRITVRSPWWEVGFDLHRGGALDSIVFPHGSGRNVLLEPLSTSVDNWSDVDARNVESRVWEENGVRMVEFRGALGPARFRTRWAVSAYSLRAEHTLSFPDGLKARRVAVGSTRLRAGLDEWGVRPGPFADPDKVSTGSAAYWGKFATAGIDQKHTPLLLFFYQRGVEGFDLTTGTDLAAWDTGLTGQSGLGRYQAANDAESIRLTREPLSVTEPVAVRPGDHTFSYHLGLPHLVERSNRRWRHIQIGNHPWPTDAQIAEWAAAGANLARIHNDYAEDGNFWRDGAWPPYDEAGMAEMRRVIAACHRHGIQVMPYFSLKEFHPEAPGYKENETAWKRSIGKRDIIHNKAPSGEFGAQMCMQSGWLERRKKDVQTAYRELGFDGIYYDWVTTQACDNPAHAPGMHLDTDAVIDMLAWTRRLLAPAGGPLVLHISGWFESITMENYADLVVNMEEFSSKAQMMTLADIPISGFQSETLPRSPCPSYRKDNAEERNRNNVALQVVLGLFPHAVPTSPAGVETLRLFRAFKPYKLEDFRFHSVYTHAITAAPADVLGALYTTPELALALVSNPNATPRQSVHWRLDPTRLGPAARVRVKDMTTGQTRVLSTREIQAGALGVDLGAYEYRLYEIRPES